MACVITIYVITQAILLLKAIQYISRISVLYITS